MDALQKLGIDGWSVLLYLVNYGILFFVLGRFVYRPLVKAMDDRSKSIKSNLDEAERIKRDFQIEMERRSKENEEFIRAMQLELMHARAEADAKSKALIADAEAKREELITQAFADVESMKRRVVSDVEQVLVGKIEKIALAAMGRDAVSDRVLSESVKRAWDEIKTSV
jgi:F-type H+-transporting ATPase subunit b